MADAALSGFIQRPQRTLLAPYVSKFFEIAPAMFAKSTDERVRLIGLVSSVTPCRSSR